MPGNPKRFVGLMFVMAGVLAGLAAFLPMMRGRPINVAFLGVGVVFLGLGLARIKSTQEPPPGERN